MPLNTYVSYYVRSMTFGVGVNVAVLDVAILCKQCSFLMSYI